MLITIEKPTEDQLRKVHNLMLNCTDKHDMFYHLIDIGVNAFHSTHMSNSFDKIRCSYSIVPLFERQKRRTYHYESGVLALTEV